MLSQEQALDTILANIEAGPVHVRPIATASGYVLAEPAVAMLDNPPFDNSAMDGFAVRQADLSSATEDQPVVLEEVTSIAAGDQPDHILPGGASCMAIMTGAPVPRGADAVVPIENTRRDGNRITFVAPPQQHANIRDRATDFATGQILASSGSVIDPLSILALAGAGISEVSVRARPRVAFVSTGKEVIDDLTADLQPGQIYNSSRPGLVAQLARFGAEPFICPSIGDSEEKLEMAIHAAAAAGCRLMISTGAVSMGAHDFVSDVLQRLGAEILFHKIKLRPGKPNLCARFPDGRIYLGLPGNPVSSACGMRFFVLPAIRKLLGMVAEKPLMAVLTEGSFRKKPGFRHMLKGHMSHTESGQLTAKILDGQMSYQVGPMVVQNCWISLPEEVSETETGMTLEIWPVDGPIFP